jgi:hypothetical protein
VAALAGLVMATTPASAHGLSVVTTAQASAQTSVPLGPRPPLGRAKPSGLTPFFGPATSPWTPLKNPPPTGTPGTMLLESDGTVLVHDEPDNNTTGGTNAWYKLTPDSSGSYIDGTWSQIASMPAAYTPLYFASAILPDGRMIVEGGEYIGENAVWSDQGDQHLGFRRTATRLDEHRGRRERCLARRHLHAPAPVSDLRHESGSDRR